MLDVARIRAWGARGRWMWIALFAGVGVSAAWPVPPRSAPVRVAAASSLHHAFQDMGAAFEQETGNAIVFAFASTGELEGRIARGAPYDVFAAASASAVDDVVRAGVCDARTKVLFARGRLAVWARGSVLLGAPTLADLSRARFAKIAIPDPEKAPYGRAARQAATMLGVWRALRPRVVYGKDAKDTLELAEKGLVHAAIVPLSLAVAARGGSYSVVDEALHQALEQLLVVCERGENAEAGRRFAAFVRSEEGREILRRYGYTPLGSVP